MVSTLSPMQLKAYNIVKNYVTNNTKQLDYFLLVKVEQVNQKLLKQLYNLLVITLEKQMDFMDQLLLQHQLVLLLITLMVLLITACVIFQEQKITNQTNHLKKWEKE